MSSDDSFDQCLEEHLQLCIDHPCSDVEGDFAFAFIDHNAPVYCCAVTRNQDGDPLILTGGGDDKGYLWDPVFGSTLHCFSGHSDSVSTVCFNKNSCLCLTGGLDGVVLIWDVKSGDLISRIELGEEIEWSQFHPNGDVWIVGTNAGNIHMHGVGRKYNVSNTFVGAHSNRPCICGRFTPDGKNIISGGLDGSLALWDPRAFGGPSSIWRSGKTLGWLKNDESIITITVHPDNIKALVGGNMGSIKLVSLKSAEILSSFDSDLNEILSIEFSPAFGSIGAGDFALVCGRGCNSVYVIDVLSNRIRLKLDHMAESLFAKWVPGSALLLATACEDHIIRLWNGRTGDLSRTFTGHKNSILCMEIDPRGLFIVSAGDDNAALTFALEN